MKKTLLALAVLTAFTGVASAQSSVNLYGTVDLNARYVKNTGVKRNASLGNNGLNSSQLGFKGTEDIGNGLKAGFTLVSGLSPDVGGNIDGTKFFNRRSTISLMGVFGEVRLGRDYVPTFWNQNLFDVYGTVGLGNSNNVRQLKVVNDTRADNSIGYFLPSNIGGAYGQVMVAASESNQNGRYAGFRGGFATGPFDIALAYGQQRLLDGALVPTYSQKELNIGTSFDFGAVKVMGYYDYTTQDKNSNNTDKEQRGSLSLAIPVGQGQISVSGNYSRRKTVVGSASTNNAVSQFAAGYLYNLSKRTAVYTTVSTLKNGNNSSLTLPTSGGAPTANGRSTGAEFGVRHFF
jgi:predicted porin